LVRSSWGSVALESGASAGDRVVQYEWLVIELIVLGLLVLELVMLHRDARRAENDAERDPVDRPPEV
jgi:hypothetical protein